MQGRLDPRTSSTLLTMTEMTTLTLAGIVVLTLAGVNLAALLLPAACCVAIASKDLLQNMMAGVCSAAAADNHVMLCLYCL